MRFDNPQAQFYLFDPDTDILPTASVGVISPLTNLDTIVAVKNPRGWDLPGGHLRQFDEDGENQETSIEAMVRELREEAACTLKGPLELIGYLSTQNPPVNGIAVFKGTCLARTFVPNDEIEDRKFLSREEFRSLYFGDQKVLDLIL
jgi:8-oxo-dGTP pyrophosphatase MutT (NUDIX family)